MHLIESITTAFYTYLEETFKISQAEAAACDFSLNIDEKKQVFGDIASNAAMILCKKLGQNPRALAQTIAQGFNHGSVERIEVAGPGFLNFFLTTHALQILARDLFTEKDHAFKLGNKAPKKNYSLEFVSGNPTGPLHLGNGRGGIIGDVLANILTFLGHSATREYYINDAGVQIVKLGASFKVRCLQAAGIDTAMPEEGYFGDYLITMAQQYISEHGTENLQSTSEQVFGEYAKTKILTIIRDTLSLYGINFDVWFSETALHKSGAIDKALALLKNKGNLYEQDGALWFKATAFGDDKDRVMRKSDGTLTYAAADVAYLENKAERKFDHLIMILGHDHHSYAVRLEALRQALGLNCDLDVILYQLVKMKADGEQVRMSKRAAHVITLKDVIDEVGTDVARFFYLHRKYDAQLEFDLDLALKKTDENPVYYVQYAYVRTNSILEKTQAVEAFADISAHDATHITEHEALLLKKIASLKSLLIAISTNYQTHLVANYTIDLANLFHHYYSHHRIIDETNIAQSRSRLLMVMLVRNTLGTLFTLLGISKPERM